MSPAAPIAGAEDRAPQVREMFDALAPRYDLANRVISMGLDQSWRRRAIAELGPAAQGDVMDLCAGTMDLTEVLLRGGARSVKALDFAAEMLAQGARKLPEGAPVEVICADAREMPVPDACVDGVIAAFGLRNVPEVHRAIEECARVLRPGGKLVVLEFFVPTRPLSRLLQGTYNRFVMPLIGGLITGMGPAFRYLAGSIDAFQTREQFSGMVATKGFEVRSWDVFPPVASIVVATRTGGEA